MIQRIQSLYLLIAGICLLALIPFDVLWAGAAASEYPWFTPTVMTLTALTGVSALGCIFLYNNRQKQLKAVVFVKYLALAVAVVLYGGLWLADEFVVVDQQGILWGLLVPLLLPVLAYVALFLSQRAIKSDIELVRSMDRLR